MRKMGSDQPRCWGSCWACGPQRPRSCRETPSLTPLPGGVQPSAVARPAGMSVVLRGAGRLVEPTVQGGRTWGWGRGAPRPRPCMPFHFTLKDFDIWKGFQMRSAGVESIVQTPPTKLAHNNDKSAFLLTEVLATTGRFSSLGPEPQSVWERAE